MQGTSVLIPQDRPRKTREVTQFESHQWESKKRKKQKLRKPQPLHTKKKNLSPGIMVLLEMLQGEMEQVFKKLN